VASSRALSNISFERMRLRAPLNSTLAKMNTLKSHADEFGNGTVTKLGFMALGDAEGYDAASSIGACSASIALIWQAQRNGKNLDLFCPNQESISSKSASDLAKWCSNYFPTSYNEYLSRAKR
jgi:hypothetical protein